ncbi:hypothetical protein B0H12DRAFT_1133727 [Mycena haematopus]|nr:hypothetical protein B0H12DRAFT_1133727 [Mycena haematopus]
MTVQTLSKIYVIKMWVRLRSRNAIVSDAYPYKSRTQICEIHRFIVRKPVTHHPPSTAVISTAVVLKTRPVAVPSKIFSNPRRNGSATRRTGPVEPARRARRAALTVGSNFSDGVASDGK